MEQMPALLSVRSMGGAIWRAMRWWKLSSAFHTVLFELKHCKTYQHEGHATELSLHDILGVWCLCPLIISRFVLFHCSQFETNFTLFCATNVQHNLSPSKSCGKIVAGRISFLTQSMRYFFWKGWAALHFGFTKICNHESQQQKRQARHHTCHVCVKPAKAEHLATKCNLGS